jgi:hypothetical protein
VGEGRRALDARGLRLRPVPEAPYRDAPPPRAAPRAPACRCCGAALSETFADLGMAPAATALVDPARAAAPEAFHRLRALVCSDCRLVQLPEGEAPVAVPEERRDAGPSAAALRAAESQVAALVARMGLDDTTSVVGIAGSGTASAEALLPLLARRGVPVLALAADEAAAEAARGRFIAAEHAPFGAATARRLRAAGHCPMLLLAGDTLSRAADPHDAAGGFRLLLAPGGELVLEEPYLPRIMQDGAFDAIRHGRFAYLSLLSAEAVLAQHGLAVFDAAEIAAEEAGGCGALRLRVRHVEDHGKPVTAAVEALRRLEVASGLCGPAPYHAFAAGVVEAKCALLDFLVGVRRAGQRVAAHGAGPRGVTLLGYCGVGPELLPFTADPDPRLHGLLLPGTRIPIRSPAALLADRPDFVLLLPSARDAETAREMAAIRDWGGRFVTATPTVLVF